MYTEQDFKNDLLANIVSDFDENSDMYTALLESEFQFENTSIFTRKVWNTYQRYLRIYCQQKFKTFLEENSSYLLSMADRVHGERNEYYIMRIDIVATFSPINNGVGPGFISISKAIKINKTTDYIGEGGCGTVYKVFDDVLNQYVAYKIFDPSSFHQADIDFLRKRFIGEGKKLIGYRHPNIVAGYEIGKIEDTPYIKMEYVEGKTLLQYVKETNPDNIVRINLANDLIAAIGYAHSKEDIHRDLSYSNIIITKAGELKLLDFGFSKGELDTSYDTTQCPVRTKFSPPEIASGAEYTFSSEVYCIGAIIYSIFTGKEFNIQNLNEINEIDIPLLYRDIILKCLDKEPNNRFRKRLL